MRNTPPLAGSRPSPYLSPDFVARASSFVKVISWRYHAAVALHDLGHGVTAVPLEDGSWQVESLDIRLPWNQRAGPHVGSAVIWQGTAYEVVSSDHSDSGQRWILRKWPEEEAMRSVFPLDDVWVTSRARAHDEVRRANRLRWWTAPIAPLLALAPSKLQGKWHSEWGFPAIGACQISAVLELAIGGAGVIQILVLAFQGDWFLPGPLKVIALVGPLALVEGFVRMIAAVGHGEPMGSLIGLPLALLSSSEPPRSRVSVPIVHRQDDGAGVLDLVSDIHRSDWVADGVLRYRDRSYRLMSSEQFGRRWLYRFEETTGEEERQRLRLWTEIETAPPAERAAPPSLVRTTVITAVVCLAPRVYQERWGRHLGVRAAWFTLIGSGAELLGGWVNLGQATSEGSWLLLLVNLYFLAEAVGRIALLVSSGRPVGSIVGWLARPLLERWVPDDLGRGARI